MDRRNGRNSLIGECGKNAASLVLIWGFKSLLNRGGYALNGEVCSEMPNVA